MLVQKLLGLFLGSKDMRLRHWIINSEIQVNSKLGSAFGDSLH